MARGCQSINNWWICFPITALFGACLWSTPGLAAPEIPGDMNDGGIATATCLPDVAPPAGNNMVNVDDLLTVINAWGPCANPNNCQADIAPPGLPVGNDVVNVDDLLAVINGWGACPCPADALEPNNTCAAARTLAAVGSDQTMIVNSSNLAGAGDVDYFRFTCNETDSSCACCGGGFCTDEDYTLTVRLDVPATAAVPYQFCLKNGDCTSFPDCVTVPPGMSSTFMIPLDGACPGVDSYAFFVRISQSGSSSTECSPYSLTYHFDALVCH